MRAAPPVEAALGTGRPERMLITLLHGLAASLLAVWAALHAELPLWQAPTLAGVLGAAAAMAVLGRWLAVRALPPIPGSLRWDGRTWSIVAGAHAQPLQRLVVALDLGIWALLQLHPADGRPVWRVVSVGCAQAQWHGLRVALAAQAGAPADAGAAP
jgi:hypothetical protein